MDFNDLLEIMKRSGLPISKIHRFNSDVADIGDQCNLTPEEMLYALTLLAKYIIFHSNLNHDARLNKNIPLLIELRSVIDNIGKRGSPVKARYLYLDILKGAAIILVILFHTVNWNSDNHIVVNSYLLNALMPMLMPTFFGISGFLLYSSKIEKTGSWILDKAKYLLIPHFAIDVLSVFI